MLQSIKQVLRFHSISKRTFADVAQSSNKIKLTLASPHQIFIKEQEVGQVNLSSTEGDLGILAGHVPVILQLRPGLIEVYPDGPASTSTSKKHFFVSGGFATVNPDSTMQIAGMEIVTIDQLDPTVISENFKNLQTRLAASANASAEEKTEISILNEVYSALNTAVNKMK